MCVPRVCIRRWIADGPGVKGLVLAGGAGTRLHPLTTVVSKQLLPVYNKPMIYYALSTLMLAGIRDLLLVSTPEQLPLFCALLGDGSRLGITLSYAAQPVPAGVADVFRVGAAHIGGDSVALVLGDNIFYGDGMPELLQHMVAAHTGASIFGYAVRDPERYGVLEFDEHGTVVGIEEKPAVPKSAFGVPGLYFYDNDVVDIARALPPSARGEIEITDVNLAYLRAARLSVHVLGRGMVWMDIGTYDALLQASTLIRAIEERQGMVIGSIEEVAYRMGYIDSGQLERLAHPLGATPYGEYLRRLAERPIR
jgi:glucose-1-phosphate thymidylyltransferase